MLLIGQGKFTDFYWPFAREQIMQRTSFSSIVDENHMMNSSSQYRLDGHARE